MINYGISVSGKRETGHLGMLGKNKAKVDSHLILYTRITSCGSKNFLKYNKTIKILEQSMDRFCLNSEGEAFVTMAQNEEAIRQTNRFDHTNYI